MGRRTWGPLLSGPVDPRCARIFVSLPGPLPRLLLIPGTGPSARAFGSSRRSTASTSPRSVASIATRSSSCSRPVGRCFLLESVTPEVAQPTVARRRRGVERDCYHGFVSIALVLLFAIAVCALPASYAWAEQPTDREVRLLARLKEVPRANEARFRRLRDLLHEDGCTKPHLREVAVEGSLLPNLECTLPGRVESLIVVGAHYDKLGGGDGVSDNWSGTCLLPSLYAALSEERRQHTFLFIGFTDEELGLVGSKSFVTRLSEEERGSIRAMINLDTLGWGSPKYFVDDAAPRLASHLEAVAARLGLDPMGTTLRSGFAEDALPFRDAGLATISFHGITQAKLRFIHTRRDGIRAINADAYLLTHRLLSAYLTSLDVFLAEQ